MKTEEQRNIFYDTDLGLEAYQLTGIVQKFPNHFHEYYVIGFIEGGCRHLWCKGEEYDLRVGDMILFNPRDNHYCAPLNGELLDYKALNIPVNVVEKIASEIYGKSMKPVFAKHVIPMAESTTYIRQLFDQIMNGALMIEKEETLYLLLELVFSEGFMESEFSNNMDAHKFDIILTYMKEHYQENILLEELAEQMGWSKYYLVRAFTRQMGVSPYHYLLSIRIEKAKELLKQKKSPIDVAMETGFTDQSHFTNCFKAYIGVTPKQYQRIF